MAERSFIPGRMRVWLGIFFAVDVASLAAYTVPILNWLAFPLLTAGAVWLLLRDRLWLLLLPLAELLWGSFGMNFSWELAGAQVSFRLLLFGICIFFWLITGGWRELAPVWRRSAEGLIFLTILLVVAWGFAAGIGSGHALRDVFFDGNAYLYLLYFPAWLSVFRSDTGRRVETLLIAAAVGLSLKTLVLFNVFANWYELLNVPYLYLWIRDTRVGEITPTGVAIWRIFIQSQLFIGVGLLQLFIRMLRRNRAVAADLLAMMLMSAALLISLSRSYWVGLVGAVLAVLIFLRAVNVSVARYLKGTAVLAGTAGAAVVLVILLAYVPFGARGFSAALSGRIISFGDPAGMSRLQLAGPLWAAIRKTPLLGQGFGTSVTYRSSDPRIRTAVNPEGLVTTYAFEWGYLDQWLKFGAVGLVLFLVALLAQFWIGLAAPGLSDDERTSRLALLAGLFFIMVVHVFSPYLNHPLGLGYLILTMVVLHSPYRHETADYQSRHV